MLRRRRWTPWERGDTPRLRQCLNPALLSFVSVTATLFSPRCSFLYVTLLAFVYLALAATLTPLLLGAPVSRNTILFPFAAVSPHATLLSLRPASRNTPSSSPSFSVSPQHSSQPRLSLQHSFPSFPSHRTTLGACLPQRAQSRRGHVIAAPRRRSTGAPAGRLHARPPHQGTQPDTSQALTAGHCLHWGGRSGAGASWWR